MQSEDKPDKPTQQARWFHARGKGWATFSDEDDTKLEQVWERLGGEQWGKQLRAKADQKERERTAQAKKDEEDQGRRNEESEALISQDTEGIDEYEWLEGSRMPKRPTLPRPNTGVDKIKSALADWLPDSVSPSASGTNTPARDAAAAGTGKDPAIFSEHMDPDTPVEERTAKVPVFEDRLFEVDLEKMLLYPVFWKGVMLRVVRANWFYSSASSGDYAPIAYDEALAGDLDIAYEKAQPWNQSCKSDSKSVDGASEKDTSKGSQSDSQPLPSMSSNATVVFESTSRGRIYSEDVQGRLLSIIGGSLIVRGFDEAVAVAREKKHDYNPFNNLSIPWADGHDSDDSDDDDEDDRKAAEGQSHASRRAGRREGAAKVPRKPKAGGGLGSDVPAGGGEERSFASRLWPSSDVLLRPGYQLLKALGFSSERASEEEERRSREKVTEEAVKGEGQKSKKKKSWTSMLGLRGANDDMASDDESDLEDVEGQDNDKILEDLSDQPPELVLCIHGIGQRLAQDFEALDFVYDVERLRNLSKKQAADPTIRRLSRGRRVQFLPICWRQGLDTDNPGEGSDNWYTLSDISNDGIPFLRNVISKVVLDVPIYMAPRHRGKMIAAVREELNRVYRLFVQRNPEFEAQGGRVSLVAHSLGSALASDILSAQPTQVPRVSDLNDQEKRDNSHLLFNVNHLFLIGSPLGFFLYLSGSQLLARRGNGRTKDVAPDAASDEVGREGCLAAEAVYNVLNPNDPVGYLLSPTVDASYASMLRPIPLPSATKSLLDSLAMPRISVSKVFSIFGEHPFEGVGKVGRHALNVDKKMTLIRQQSMRQEADAKHKKGTQPDESSDESVPLSADPVMTESGIEHKKSIAKQVVQEQRQTDVRPISDPKEKRFRWDDKHLEKAERRLRALNPHGCLDYTLVPDGGVLSGLLDNQYLLMLGAHTSYWTSKQFSTFLLTQVMLYGSDSKEDASDNEDGPIPTLVPILAAPGEGSMSIGLKEESENKDTAQEQAQEQAQAH